MKVKRYLNRPGNVPGTALAIQSRSDVHPSLSAALESIVETALKAPFPVFGILDALSHVFVPALKRGERAPRDPHNRLYLHDALLQPSVLGVVGRCWRAAHGRRMVAHCPSQGLVFGGKLCQLLAELRDLG